MDDFPPPEAPHPPDDRHRHPYHMHEMIRRQPIAARTTLTAVREGPIPELPREGRVLFTGIGTSFHVAQGLARAAVAESPLPLRHAVAIPAFELRGEPPGLDEVRFAVLASESGTTDVTRRAAERLRSLGIPTLLISAHETGPIAEITDGVLVTRYSQELSWTHTVSWTAALTAGYALLARWGNAPEDRWATLEGIPDALTAALASENRLVDVAERLADRPRWVLLGTGPRSVTVREGALKLREGAGKFVVTHGVEEFLHGPMSPVDDGCVVAAIVGTPLEAARASQGLEAARELGAETMLFDSTPDGSGPDHWTTLPLPGPYSPLVDVVPFQLLTYWMATSLGRNPDVMGLDDPKHRAARSKFGL